MLIRLLLRNALTYTYMRYIDRIMQKMLFPRRFSFTRGKLFRFGLNSICMRRFVHPKVVKPCCQLLATFEKNGVYTNHCLVKMMHRLAWDCKYPVMFFQASAFRTFQKILTSKLDQYKVRCLFIYASGVLPLYDSRVFFRIFVCRSCKSSPST